MNRLVRPCLRCILAACLLPVFLTGCAPDPEPDVELSQAQLGAIAATVAAALGDGEAVDTISTPGIRDVYVALYGRGDRLSHSWGHGQGTDDALEAALGQLGKSGPWPDVDYVELSLAWGFRRVDPARLGDDLSRAHRGVRGLQVTHAKRALRFAPSMMVAENLSFERALSRSAQQLQLSGEALLAEAELATFEALQVIVRPGDDPTASQLFRGSHLVSPDDVDLLSVTQSAALMRNWMRQNLHADGRMTYMLYPVSGKESISNNMIRQWMASLCLTRMAVSSGDPQLRERALQNIRYNLAQFYSEEQGLGVIEYRGNVKLGAVALAALAILEHPDGEQLQAEFDALVATTDKLWNEDGSFENFYRPASRNADPNFNNFYPGETLLLWAKMLDKKVDHQREARFMQSFRYFRDWHLANRKPSFIPWHTQAYYLVWQRTGNPEIRDWIFRMNDWLLGMQANSRVAYDDTVGRFYDPAPEHAHFGPPHASSTGVYLEGLIDAFQLALAEKDASRARAYAESIRLGLRSAIQLQLRDDETLWFSPDRDRAAGGLRTTVYNNVVRVDNVQHTLMAAMKILAYVGGEESRLIAAEPGHEPLLAR